MTSNASMCMSCSDGYWLTSQKECLACPAYCKTCTSATWCTALFNPVGFTLLYVSAGVNYPAACDPGCSYCSTVNPQECMMCMTGFYLTANMWCKPCTAASQCGSCSSTDPAICTSCMADAYLDTVDNTCKPC
jgi:proprotein convertase subtilisin/kexin type 5